MKLAVKTYNDLFKKMGRSLEKVTTILANVSKQVIDSFIRDYYAEYFPMEYNRTMQFLESCMISNLEKSGNKYEIKVYIDYANLHYEIGNGWRIVNWANNGLHGGFDPNQYHQDMPYRYSHFWDDSMENLLPDDAVLINTFVYWLEKNTGCTVEER